MADDVREGEDPKEDESPKYAEYWPQFNLAMQNRLVRGHQEYGNASFSRSEKELLRELQEEVLDIAGWGFILWVRLKEVEKALEECLDV